MNDDASWGNMWYYWYGHAPSGATARTSYSYSEAELLTNMNHMKSKFVDNGYPVIIGEFGANHRDMAALGGNQSKHDESLQYWYNMSTVNAYQAGIIPFAWDINSSYRPGMMLMDRSAVSVYDYTAYNGIMQGDQTGRAAFNAIYPTPSSGSVQYSGSVCWTFSQGTANQAAEVSSTLAGYVTPSVSIGSHLTYKGVKMLSSLTETLTGVTVDKESTANSANALSFNVQPLNGCTFTATRVEFTATRIGTDGGKIDAAWNGTSLTKGVTPARNGKTPDYTTYTFNVQGALSSALQSLVLNLYSLGITKQYGFANVRIYGTLSRTAFSSAKAYGEAVVTGVSVNEAAAVKTDNDIFDLMGRKVGAGAGRPSLRKGSIYVCKGKKFVAK